MNIFTIPLKNIRRKKIRTLTILFIFSVGIISAVSFYKISNIVLLSFEEKLNKYGANIIINSKTDTLNITYGGVNLGSVMYDIKYLNLSKSIEKIKNIKFNKNISTIAPKLIVVKEYNNKSLGFVGIEFENEIKLKNYWHINGKLPTKDNEIIAGNLTATLLNLKPGSTIQAFGETFIVTGVLDKLGSEEDHLLFIDLNKLQKLSNLPNKANFIEIAALCAGCPIDDIVDELEKALPDAEINAVQKVVKQRMSALHFVEHLSYVVISIMLLTSCFIIGLFVFNSVNERKKEIGILRSMGYEKKDIFIIFSFEGVFIGFFSAIIGYIIGLLLSKEILQYLHIDKNKIVFSFPEMILLILLVMLLTLLASSYPSYKGTKIEPSDTITAL
ncbi:MAG: FtsX-like permease family protein [Calditerrivibrio sp.]|nr:FtsX-like permease family protein [Calditerrivibrio sp.]